MPGSRVSLNRRTLIKSGLVLGASQVIGAPFIVKSLADEPVKIGMVNPHHRGRFQPRRNRPGHQR